ncbi:MAG: phosphate uptake regulator PhoU [Nanoarchaeota archaeon]|nr:phosphate uptake regulator PhoU [Nanoarchaeota archaeon]
MEYRKIIEFGKTSFVISLPKYWVRRNNLKKGDTINLLEDKDNLIVCPKEKKDIHEPLRTTILTETKELKEIQAEIVAAYLANYDIIDIKGRNLQDFVLDIKTTFKNLIGMELIEQETNRILARDLINLKEVSIESLIRRIDIIIRSMIKDSTSNLHEDYYESIFQRDNEINKLTLLLKRVIKLALEEPHVAEKLKRKNKELLKDWNIISLLESIGDEVKRISRLYGKLNKNKNKVKEINSMLGDKYFQLMKAYHKNNIPTARKINLEHQDRMKQIDDLNLDHNLSYHLKNLNSCLKNMARTVEW